MKSKTQLKLEKELGIKLSVLLKIKDGINFDNGVSLQAVRDIRAIDLMGHNIIFVDTNSKEIIAIPLKSYGDLWCLLNETLERFRQ